MATIKIDQFHGIQPRVHPSLLADGMAVEAHNCRLKNGKLVPLRMPEKLAGKTVNLENNLQHISEAKSLFLWKHGSDSEFLAFPGIAFFAEGNIADDEYDRIFVTGETGAVWNGENNVPVAYLKKPNSSKIIRHPVPKKNLPAPLARLGTTTGSVEDPDNVRYTFFIQTWVDPYGYESGASPVSKTWKDNANGQGEGAYTDDDFQYNDGDPVIFQGLTDDEVPEGGGTANNPTPGYKRRIYKVVAGAETQSFRFLAEFSVSPWTQKSVRVKDEDVGEMLPQIESVPSDIKNMTYVPGGFYTAYSPSNPKTVIFSDVGNPTSWPIAYRYDLRDNIVALAVSTNTVFALTDGFPCVLTGTAPESMTVTMLAGPAACVSPRSVCLYKNAVCYASNVGICMISSDASAGTVVNNLTDKIFTKEQWQAFNPSSCLMAQFDGALFCFFTLDDGHNTRKGIVVDLLESENAVTTHDEQSSCLCVDDSTDVLYFVRSVDAD